MIMPERYKPLGERLIEAGKLSRPQLELALVEQRRSGKLLGSILLELEFIKEDDLSEALASELPGESLETFKLDSLMVEPEALRLIPKDFSLQHLVLPLSLSDGTITVAMANPYDVITLDNMQRLANRTVEVVPLSEEEIRAGIEWHYGEYGEKIEELMEESLRLATSKEGMGDLTKTAPLVRLVDQIIIEAVKERATDVHIEPGEKYVRIRYRVDGILRVSHYLPKALQPAITNRIKIQSNISISEYRVPQDGRYTFYLGKKRVDMRVSTYPTIHGENLVLRVLDKTQLVVGLEVLGFSEENLLLFQKVLATPHGIILVTGPTGSGKTTTLYSLITYLNSLEKNIVTLEDPVEYEFPGIRQAQVNPRAGFDFAEGLRSILRQDPDIILVGEMRDMDTIELTVRAALTGHLVLSTLHTNDAPGAIPRLIDMGVKPFLISSILRAILAQRLVRLICEYCKEEYVPEEEMLRLLETHQGVEIKKFYRGQGCTKCFGTGYRGRIGIFELILVSEDIQRIIMAGGDSSQIREIARAEGMKTMLEDGLEKVKKGLTTIEEVLRVAA